MPRPVRDDSANRAREVLRHLSDGNTLKRAAELAKVDPGRVLTLLQKPDYRAAVCGLLEEAA